MIVINLKMQTISLASYLQTATVSVFFFVFFFHLPSASEKSDIVCFIRSLYKTNAGLPRVFVNALLDCSPS